MKTNFKIVSVILLVYLFDTSCNHKQKSEYFFESKGNAINIFNITKSEYNYNKDFIYLIDIPYPLLYRNFLTSNYFILKNNRVYSMSIFNDCRLAYVEGKYEIGDRLLSKNLDNYNQCDIHLSPFIDFSLNERDTLVYNDRKIILDSKIYDTSLKDTIYKFQLLRGLIIPNATQTIVLATKKIGLVGVYDSNAVKKTYKNAIGYTHKLDSIELRTINMQKPTINLKDIKEFKLND